MLTQDILAQIPHEDTPVFLYNTPKENFEYFCCQLQTSEELSILRNNKKKIEQEIREEDLGLYILNADVEYIYDKSVQRNKALVANICSNLLAKYKIAIENRAVAFTLFSILHEFGHWRHYISSKLSRMEYWKKYELDRDGLWMEFQYFYNFCCHTEEENSKHCLNIVLNILSYQLKRLPINMHLMNSPNITGIVYYLSKLRKNNGGIE